MFSPRHSLVLQSSALRYCTIGGGGVRAEYNSAVSFFKTVSTICIWGLSPFAWGLAHDVRGMAPFMPNHCPLMGGVAPQAWGLVPCTQTLAPRIRGAIPQARGIKILIQGAAPHVRGIIPQAWGVIPRGRFSTFLSQNHHFFTKTNQLWQELLFPKMLMHSSHW